MTLGAGAGVTFLGQEQESKNVTSITSAACAESLLVSIFFNSQTFEFERFVRQADVTGRLPWEMSGLSYFAIQIQS